MARKIAEDLPLVAAVLPSTGGAYELKDGVLVRVEAMPPEPEAEAAPMTDPETPTEKGA